jgi:acetyl-CoA acetyltransferase
MREAVIFTSLRTGLAKSFRGSFNLTRPDDLGALCIQAVLREAPQLDPGEVEDVILGCAQLRGEQGQNVTRIAAMLAGLPVTAAATAVNRFCLSGPQAVAMTAPLSLHEGADAAIAGGVESISLTPRDNQPNARLQEKPPGICMVMGARRRWWPSDTRSAARRWTNMRSPASNERAHSRRESSRRRSRR